MEGKVEKDIKKIKNRYNFDKKMIINIETESLGTILGVWALIEFFFTPSNVLYSNDVLIYSKDTRNNNLEALITIFNHYSQAAFESTTMQVLCMLLSNKKINKKSCNISSMENHHLYLIYWTFCWSSSLYLSRRPSLIR